MLDPADRAWKAPRTLEQCHNILDLRALAKRKLPAPVFHFLDGAAEDEATSRRNSSAFDELKIIPRCLVDVASVKTATRILGQDTEWPIICSPTGGSRFYHPQGELAVAGAAASAGMLYGLSTASTYGLEEVAATNTGPKVFQLYIFKNRDVTRELIARSKQAGYRALCLTVDTPVTGKRERDLRTGWGIPIRLSANIVASFALHPMWLLGLARGGVVSMPIVARLAGSTSVVAQMQYIAEQLDPSVTWSDVRQIIELWNGPFAIKGIMSIDDAHRAADVGATAIIVSNHGGRQLDGAAAAVEVLPGIVQAVGGAVEVILDGGIRRGVHVLKALALGAKACSIGRPYLYGLAAGGERGVRKALQILQSELLRSMRLSGCTDVKSIGRDLVWRLGSL